MKIILLIGLLTTIPVVIYATDTDINAQDEDGQTALHRLARSAYKENSYYDEAKKLLEQGALVDPVDNHGDTPLHRAIASFQISSHQDSHVAIVKLLVSYG